MATCGLEPACPCHCCGAAHKYIFLSVVYARNISFLESGSDRAETDVRVGHSPLFARESPEKRSRQTCTWTPWVGWKFCPNVNSFVHGVKQMAWGVHLTCPNEARGVLRVAIEESSKLVSNPSPVSARQPLFLRNQGDLLVLVFGTTGSYQRPTVV